MHPKGNHPSKFQLIRRRRFGGYSEQTNKLADKQTLLHPITLDEGCKLVPKSMGEACCSDIFFSSAARTSI